MKKNFVLLAFCVAIFSSVVTSDASDKVYKDFKIYDIKPKNEKDLNILKKLEDEESDLDSRVDFLSFHNNLNDFVRVAVEPKRQNYFEKILMENEIDFKIKTSNLQK